MSKFHIKKDGTPGTCNATKGNCPLGGSDSHFDSAEEAQAAAQAKLEKQFGVTEKPSVDLTKTIPIDFVKDYKVDKDYYLKDGEDEDYFFGEVNMELLQLNMEELDGLKEGEEYKVYCEVEYDEDEIHDNVRSDRVLRSFYAISCRFPVSVAYTPLYLILVCADVAGLYLL